MSLFALFDAFRWVYGFFFFSRLVTKLAQANKMNMCICMMERETKKRESYDENQNWLDGLHSCVNKGHKNIYARHSTSTNTHSLTHTCTNTCLSQISNHLHINVYNDFTSRQSLSLELVYIIIWLFIFKNRNWNFTKKKLLNLHAKKAI